MRVFRSVLFSLLVASTSAGFTSDVTNFFTSASSGASTDAGVVNKAINLGMQSSDPQVRSSGHYPNPVSTDHRQ